jgi:hypothetical protein
MYKLYIKLVGLPCKTDFAKDNDFCAALFALLFHTALRLLVFVFEVLFFGTAIIFSITNNT